MGFGHFSTVKIIGYKALSKTVINTADSENFSKKPEKMFLPVLIGFLSVRRLTHAVQGLKRSPWNFTGLFHPVMENSYLGRSR